MTPEMVQGRYRRGVALVLVLGLLVTIATISTAMLRRVAHDRLMLEVDQHTRVCDELLGSLDAVVLHWLHQSFRVALATDGEEAGFLVERVRLDVGGVGVDVSVHAFDQAAMTRSRYPSRAVLGPTHNPRPESLDQRAVVNILTAPRALLEEATSPSERDAVARLIAARALGRRPSIGALAMHRPGDPATQRYRLVDASPAWTIRTDLTTARVRRSWISVYIMDELRWRRVLRIAIAGGPEQ